MGSEVENRNLITAAFDAIQRNDVRTFWNHQSKDVAAHVFDQGPLSGDFRGQGPKTFIPCQILDLLEDFRGQRGPTPDVGEGEEPPDSPLKPVAGGYPRMASVATLTDSQFAAIVYVAPEGTDVTTGVVGVVLARIEGSHITEVWHFPVAHGQNLTFVSQQPVV